MSKFVLSQDIIKKALKDTQEGIRILLEPCEVCAMMVALDRTLNKGLPRGASTDVEWVREKLSDLLESPSSRRKF